MANKHKSFVKKARDTWSNKVSKHSWSMQDCSDIWIYNHIMIQEDLPQEDSASALDCRNEMIILEQPFPATWLFKLERCRPAGQSSCRRPWLLTRRRWRLCWPSHGCHCLQPVISRYRPRILMLEHENSSFAGGPAAGAGPGAGVAFLSLRGWLSASECHSQRCAAGDCDHVRVIGCTKLCLDRDSARAAGRWRWDSCVSGWNLYSTSTVLNLYYACFFRAKDVLEL